MLQEEIKKIEQFFRGIEYYNDAIIVKVTFPNNWKVFTSNDGLMKPAKSDREADLYYYYGNKADVSLDDLFSFIEETINANIDAEKKFNLYNEKRIELENLFKSTPYEELINLKFVIEEAKQEEIKKPKRKYTRKKKAEPAEVVDVEQAIENNNKEENVEVVAEQ